MFVLHLQTVCGQRDKTYLFIFILFTVHVHVYDCGGVQQDRQKFLELLEKRAKKRQKLLSMKRHSSLLKRPEILETVYR